MTERSDERLDRERGLEIARTCTYFNVRKATRILGDLFDDALRPHGLKGTQFSLLVAVSLAEGPTVGRLAEILAADRTTLTRTLAPLERDGLLESRPGEDKRERRLYLTAEGDRRLCEASSDWERAQQAIVEELGAGSWEDLMTGVRAVHGMGRTGETEAT
ncbi:MAG TPA: MarR family transcriptional regulator [Trueperaceae bacterium]